MITMLHAIKHVFASLAWIIDAHFYNIDNMNWVWAKALVIMGNILLNTLVIGTQKHYVVFLDNWDE